MKVRLLVLLLAVFVPMMVFAEGSFVKENKKSEMGREPFKISNYPEFQDVRFSSQSTTVSPKYYEMLDQVLGALKGDPHLRVSVDGYSNDTMSATENMRISKMRAMNVEEYLVKNGLPPHRVEVAWHGNNVPTSPVVGKIIPIQNRRATVTLFRRDALKELPKDLGLTE